MIYVLNLWLNNLFFYVVLACYITFIRWMSSRILRPLSYLCYVCHISLVWGMCDKSSDICYLNPLPIRFWCLIFKTLLTNYTSRLIFSWQFLLMVLFFLQLVRICFLCITYAANVLLLQLIDLLHFLLGMGRRWRPRQREARD